MYNELKKRKELILHKRWVTIRHKVKSKHKKPDTSVRVELKRDKNDWDKVLNKARINSEEE